MASPLKLIFSGFMQLIVGCVFLWQAIAATHQNERLAVNPHERARVENTWTTSGRNASRYADLSFANPEGGALCHAKKVQLGATSVSVKVGAWMDVVPIPGSCDVDAPTAATSGWLVDLQYAMAFFIFASGLLSLAGMPISFSRLRAST